MARFITAQFNLPRWWKIKKPRKKFSVALVKLQNLFSLRLLLGLGLLFSFGFELGFGRGDDVAAMTTFFGAGLFFGHRRGGRNDGRGAFDAHFQCAFDFRVQGEFHFEFADRADGAFELNLLFVERDVELVLEFISNRAARDGAEQLAVFAGLDLDNANQFLERLSEVGHVIKFVCFAFGALLLERFELALIRRRDRHGEALWEKIIARVTGGDADVVRFTTETDDVLREDNFSFCHTKNILVAELKNQNGTSSLSGGPSPSTGSAAGAAAVGRAARGAEGAGAPPSLPGALPRN